MIYLDNAATSFPKPKSVINAMCSAQYCCGANPGRGGHALSVKAGQLVYRCREKLAEHFSCSSENVVFTSNCTAALNTAIKGVLKKGDHVIISSLEHNSVSRPVHAMSEKGIITYSVATVNPLDDNETLKSFASHVKENTRAIITTHVSNVFGTVLPVEKLCALCRARGLLFILDGAQSAGSHIINLEKEGIDVLCIPGHKGLLGPMGTGAIMFRDGVEIKELIQGGTGSNSLSLFQPAAYPDRLESGTLNLPGIAGLYEGIMHLEKIGGERAVLSHEGELVKMLSQDLSVIKGVTVYKEMQGDKATNLVSFNLGDLHSESVASLLDKRGFAVRAGYHCSYLAHKTYKTSEKGCVRVSPGIFTSKKDVKNFVFYLNKIAMDKNLC